MQKNIYITTPAYYVNDRPHIGHAYTTLACDTLARFWRLNGSSVIHLAAQAGVSYSLTNPKAYIHSNINGFFNVIEASRTNDIRHFVHAHRFH